MNNSQYIIDEIEQASFKLMVTNSDTPEIGDRLVDFLFSQSLEDVEKVINQKCLKTIEELDYSGEALAEALITSMKWQYYFDETGYFPILSEETQALRQKWMQKAKNMPINDPEALELLRLYFVKNPEIPYLNREIVPLAPLPEPAKILGGEEQGAYPEGIDGSVQTTQSYLDANLQDRDDILFVQQGWLLSVLNDEGDLVLPVERFPYWFVEEHVDNQCVCVFLTYSPDDISLGG